MTNLGINEIFLLVLTIPVGGEYSPLVLFMRAYFALGGGNDWILASRYYGGTACKFCMLHRGRGWQDSFVEPTKLTRCTSVCAFVRKVVAGREGSYMPKILYPTIGTSE